MTEIDTASAADALRAAAAQDAADSAIPSTSTEQAPQTTETVTQGQDTQSNQDKPTGLFHDVDPEKLTPEMRSLFDGMQKSYTQKSQEIAEKSRQYDAFGDVEQVKSAVEFVQALQDPTNLVQLQSEISDYLQSIGYSKADSDSAAVSAVTEQQETPFNEFESPSAIDPTVEQKLQELENFKQQYEQEKLQADIEASLSRQENIIRNQNPSYTDDDIQTVYQLSYAYGGDLMSAQKAYEGERQRILASYANAKSSVTDAIGSPAVGAHAQAPADLSDWRAATDYAKRRLAALDGLGALDN